MCITLSLSLSLSLMYIRIPNIFYVRLFSLWHCQPTDGRKQFSPLSARLIKILHPRGYRNTYTAKRTLFLSENTPRGPVEGWKINTLGAAVAAAAAAVQGGYSTLALSRHSSTGSQVHLCRKYAAPLSSSQGNNASLRGS